MEDINLLKKRAMKSEWIHHEYVEMYKPYRGKKLDDKDVQFLKKQMRKIDVEADKRFGIMKEL